MRCLTAFLLLAIAALWSGPLELSAQSLVRASLGRVSPANDEKIREGKPAPPGSAPTEALVATSTDAPRNAEGLDEMLRASNGQWQYWRTVPELVVLTSVMEYHTRSEQRYHATSEQLSHDEVDHLVADLTVALRLLTDGRFNQFAAIRREAVSTGDSVSIVRPAQIVVGRYRGVLALEKTLGLGGRRTRDDGTITGAAIVLDSDYDRTNSSRRLLRTHELGHALGYNHVTSRESIMNTRIGPEPTDADRRVVRFAFDRLMKDN